MKKKTITTSPLRWRRQNTCDYVCAYVYVSNCKSTLFDFSGASVSFFICMFAYCVVRLHSTISSIYNDGISMYIFIRWTFEAVPVRYTVDVVDTSVFANIFKLYKSGMLLRICEKKRYVSCDSRLISFYRCYLAKSIYSKKKARSK